ncbi:hypothetical protein ACEZCY_02935 [Streptacidiphilus sp. N1-12]|uniref:Uncharacterized protein n=2 Tax=Streptacidiphilus alkalitolerans TaxID=3342712 RepID=A0ABV6V3H9_9ACTN
MGFTGSVHDLKPRWSVDLPISATTATAGKQTFIVLAHTFAEAVEAAWEEAHTPQATRHRKGAALAAQRHDLHARMLSVGLF